MQIGTINRLAVVRDSPYGMFLTDGESDVLLPRKYVPPGTEVGDEVDVFVGTDSEDRPLATTQRPLGMVGDVVPLVAKEVGRAGAFMDWGLDKDLLVPYSEQHHRMRPGETHTVLILLDQSTGRLYGTTRLADHLTDDAGSLAVGDPVQIMVADIGKDTVRVVVNGSIFATIFADEIFGTFELGDRRSAWVKQIREDGRIAISLSPQGRAGVQGFEKTLLEYIQKRGGTIPFGDASSPETIRSQFGVSKGTFKKALGGLFKAGLVDLNPHATRLRKP